MISPKTKISDFIDYGEVIRSAKADQLEINNEIRDPATIARAVYVATSCFDPMRVRAGAPLGVNSFYRCRELNREVGSTDRSHHLIGAAIDVDADKYQSCKVSNAQLFIWAVDNLEFDQIIWEGSIDSDDWMEGCKWVHIASQPGQHRRKITLYNQYDKEEPYRSITAEELVELRARHGL